MDNIKSTDEVIKMIAEALEQSDGVTIEDVAESLDIKANYQGDSIFVVYND